MQVFKIYKKAPFIKESLGYVFTWRFYTDGGSALLDACIDLCNLPMLNIVILILENFCKNVLPLQLQGLQRVESAPAIN